LALWGEYQSVIQLGAAINFGYAAFDLVYRSASSPVIEAFDHMQSAVSEALEKRTSNKMPIPVSANQFQSLKRASATIRMLSQWVSATSPAIPILSGFVSTVLLFVSSEIYATPLGLHFKLVILVCGYAWIAFMGAAIVTAYVLCHSVKK
jgi:hypothetical protein